VPRTITDAELAARGVPAGTTKFWAERGVLARTDRAGVYELSDEIERRLAAFSPPSARKAAAATSSPPAPPRAKPKGATKRAAQAGRPSKADAAAAASSNGRAAKKATRDGRTKAVRSRAAPGA
jgi:hypothetical protein